MFLRRLMVFCFSFAFLVMLSTAQDDSFAALIADNPNYSTFNSYVSADLNSLIGAEANYLLFVPNNTAFENLPRPVFDYLNQNPDFMLDVLRYHIAENRDGTIMSLDGEMLDMVLTMVDGIDILSSSPAQNGTIYEIDELLLPDIALPQLDYASLEGLFHLEGSETVAPLSDSIISSFNTVAPKVQITVETTGTGDGFQALCFRLEAQVIGASRPIRQDEEEVCQINNLYPIGFQVGIDALAIMVSSSNTFVDNLSFEQLAKVFSDPRDATGAVIRPRRWSDIDPTWPNQEIQRFFPSEIHGTFDYFVATIYQPIYRGIAEGRLNLADYDFYSPVDFVSDGLFAPDGTVILDAGSNLAEALNTARSMGDTGLLAQLSQQESARIMNPLLLSQAQQKGDDFTQLRREIAVDSSAIGFLAYNYLSSEVKAVAINNIEANLINVRQESYPLARPLFIYSDAGMMQSQAALSGFIHYYLTTISSSGLPEGYFLPSLRDLRMSRLQWIAAMAFGN